MTGQLNIDFDAAQAAKTEAIDRVEKNADDDWKNCALDAIYQISRSKTEFTTDDIWVRIGIYHPGVETHEPRAMGAVIRQAARSGIIEATGHYTTSGRPECHGRPVMIWKSKVCG